MKSIEIKFETGSMYINSPLMEGYKFPLITGESVVYAQFTHHENIQKSFLMESVSNNFEEVIEFVLEGMNRTADADDEEEVEVIDGVQVIRKHPSGAVFSDGGLKDEDEVSV